MKVPAASTVRQLVAWTLRLEPADQVLLRGFACGLPARDRAVVLVDRRRVRQPDDGFRRNAGGRSLLNPMSWFIVSRRTTAGPASSDPGAR